MAKKKNYDFGFTPSPYQEKIFDFISEGVGNAVVIARAGCGKTATAVSSLKLIPKSQKSLFLAFNKSIADELSKKLTGLNNVSVRTTHSLGYAIIKKNLGNVEVEDYKYRTYIKQNIGELTSCEEMITSRTQLTEYIDNIMFLTNFARLYYCQSEKEIDVIADKYDIPVSLDECSVVLKILNWGKENTNVVDYIDMLWLPVELKMNPFGFQYDWIFLDEAQDTSVIAIEMIKKCFKRNTRMVSIGDNFQCINQFAGSSDKSFEELCNMPNTQTFDLPISYRCDKNIIKLANTIVPDIYAREDADDGKIIDVCRTNILKDGDMVLSRTKAPLLTLYNKLLKKGVNCYVKGSDIGLNLIKKLENVDEDNLGQDLKEKGVFTTLYQKMFSERNKLMSKRGLDYDDATLSQKIMDEYDSINSLITLSSGLKYKQDLIEKIKKIFKEENNGICLSTIHKSKGLEAENVYILCHSSMPSKLAKKKWEIEQEQDLIYVAYTRAKHKLGFVSEKEIPSMGSSLEPMAIINELMYIENVVCETLGLEPTVRMSSVDIAKFNINNATKIEDKYENLTEAFKDNTIKIGKDDDLLLYLSNISTDDDEDDD